MTKFNTKTPSGFPEFSPAAEYLRQQWLKKIEYVFCMHGFVPVTTPMVEREENLVAKGGNAKEMYVLKRFLDEDGDTSHSGNAMRFDHTVPLALYTVRHLNEIAFPFRRYAIGPVFRGERAQKGRYRQFTQCDIDIIGNETLSTASDADVLLVAYDIYQALDLGKVVFRVNNRKLLKSALAAFGVQNDAQMKTVMDIVDSRDKIGDAKTLSELKEAGIDRGEDLLRFGELRGGYEAVLGEVRSLLGDEIYAQGGQELEDLMVLLKDSGAHMDSFEVDMGIARGLDYYTGMVVEAQLVAHPEFRTVGAGGRYDDLAGIFSQKSYPGVGFSLGLTRLFAQCLEQGLLETKTACPAKIIGLAWDTAYLPAVAQLAGQARKAGIPAMVYTEKKKLNKQFSYAEKLGIDLAFILGEDEMRDNTVVVKNLSARTQETIPQADFVAYIETLVG